MNEIKFQILADGTVTVTTGDLSGPNHMSADQLLDQLEAALGGKTTAKRRDKFDVEVELHAALHKHAQDGHTH